MSAHFEYMGIEPFQDELTRVMLVAVKNRIFSGRDVNDQPAPALSRAYARAKQRRGLPQIRNWSWTGQTLESVAMLRGHAGQLVIGFNNSFAARKAAINNARVRQWGLSAADRERVIQAVNGIRGQLVRVAA